jgi:hypothetical protein
LPSALAALLYFIWGVGQFCLVQAVLRIVLELFSGRFGHESVHDLHGHTHDSQIQIARAGRAVCANGIAQHAVASNLV